MLYVLDHYYAIDHENYCLVVESDKSPKEIVEICSAITFLFEDVVDDSTCLSMPCLLTILQEYYGVKDRKHDFPIEALRSLKMPIDDVYEKMVISTSKSFGYMGYIVDLYEAREYCCGEKYKKIMNKWLPKGQDLENLKALLQKEGVEI